MAAAGALQLYPCTWCEDCVCNVDWWGCRHSSLYGRLLGVIYLLSECIQTVPTNRVAPVTGERGSGCYGKVVAMGSSQRWWLPLRVWGRGDALQATIPLGNKLGYLGSFPSAPTVDIYYMWRIWETTTPPLIMCLILASVRVIYGEVCCMICHKAGCSKDVQYNLFIF